MRDVEKTWHDLIEMPKEKLESYLEVNPKTGEPDGLYTLLLQGAEPRNLEYVSKRDGISTDTAKQRVFERLRESGYDVPLSLLN